MSSASRLLVAVDFGTTASSLAWGLTDNPGVQTLISQWPDDSPGVKEGTHNDKVPTELAYDSSPNPQWGYQIKESDLRYQWFKLGIDPSYMPLETRNLAQEFPSSNAMPNNDDPALSKKLTTDFLHLLGDHARHVLERHLVLRPIEWIITVPAMWGDAAKDKLRRCAKNANMGRDGNLHIVTEPEAAAVYALTIIPNTPRIGDAFVLCDAGGGTVDLITYKIVALKPVLEIEEAVPGAGSLCGSVFLNRLFKKYLEGRFQAVQEFDDRVRYRVLREFELFIKRRYNGGPEPLEISVKDIPDNLDYGISNSKLLIPSDHLYHVFEPVVSLVIGLVQRQINSCRDTRPKALLLVGGFGQSPYLRNRIQGAIGSDIQVFQPPNGLTAVVKGALIKRLAEAAPHAAAVRVSARRSRCHYGMPCRMPVVGGENSGLSGHWDSYRGILQAPAMQWHIRIGDLLSQDEPVQWYHTRTSPVQEEMVHTCSRFPVDLMYNTIDEDPPSSQNGNCKILCRLHADFSSVWHQVPVKMGNDNRFHYIIKFSIRATFYSAHIKYELLYGDIVCNSVHADYP